MGLPEINRARIEALKTEINNLQGDFEVYVPPPITEDSYPNVKSNAPGNVRAFALFRTIMVAWSYDYAPYIAKYEVYASKNAGFTPTPADLVWTGRDAGYNHPASLGETWYFRVRVVNMYDVASDFSEEVFASTVDIKDFEIEEKYRIDTIEYANQYTDERRDEIMEAVASKLDATVYHDNIVLKADVATVNEQFESISTEMATKADDAQTKADLALRELSIHRGEVAPEDLNQLWLDTNSIPNVLKQHDGTSWVKATPTSAGEVGAYTTEEVDTALDAKASKASFDTLTGRMDSAETSITQNAEDIALRATQTELDSLTGRVDTAEASIIVNAGEIALKANQTTVDGLNDRIESAETSITANAEEIALRAKSTDLDTLADRVTTAESSITANAEQIGLRVTQTTYDTDINDEANGLIARMNNAESSITAQAGQIALKASQTELDTRMGDVVDRLDLAEASITVNANAITSKVEVTTYNTGLSNTLNSAKAYTDSIEVGTRNLLRGLGGEVYDPNRIYGNYEANLEEVVIGGKKWLKYIGSNGMVRINHVTLEPNTQYTYSFDCFADAGYDDTITFANYDGVSYGTGSWHIKSNVTRAKYTFTTRASTTYDIMHITGIATGAHFANFKLEKGNKATDWTPAPEDVDASIGALDARIVTAETSITQNSNAIALKASQSALDTTNSRLSTAESTLTVHTGQIATKVEKNGVISSINQTAESVKISAAKVSIDGDLVVENGLVRLKDLIVDKAHIKDGAIIERMLSSQVIANVVNAGTALIDFAKIGQVEITDAHITGRISANKLQIGPEVQYASGYDPTKIEVGGRNLARRSNEFNVGSPATGITTSLTAEGYLQVVTTSGNGNWLSGWAKDIGGIEEALSEGDEFTISFLIKRVSGSGQPTIYVKGGMGYYSLKGSIGTNFSTLYYSGTWKDANSISPHLGWSGSAGTFVIKAWKIEKGNRATDWTPAPEDVDSSIASAESSAKSHADSKASTAESNAKSHANTVASTAESNAKSHANSLNTSVRNDMRLTAPLPTSLTLDGNGITASTSTSGKYVRMDYRGLYVAGGAIVIDGGLSDSQIANASTWHAKETPNGAQSKADTAKSQAISTASSDATSKANTAETNAKNHANSKDSTLRSNLRLTAALPTSITMDANGITASASTGKYARLDHRGLYIYGGGIVIDGGLPDSEIANASTWHAKETPSGAQSKASTAETNAKNYAYNNYNGTKTVVDSWKYPNTTEINGGNIRTNTIDANRLKANTVIANNITFTGILSGATGDFTGDVTATSFSVDAGATSYSAGLSLKYTSINSARKTSTISAGWSSATGDIMEISTDGELQLSAGVGQYVRSFNDVSVSGNISATGTINASSSMTANAFYTSNWFRSRGSTGWYNQDYGGGIYMTDSTWVRTYNNKGLLVNNQIQASNFYSNDYVYVKNDVQFSGTYNRVGSSSSNDGIYLWAGSGSTYAKMKTDGAFFLVVNGSTKHTFYAGGTKSGGSIVVDGKNLGMSPIDSPQILLEYIEFDVPLDEKGVTVYIDDTYLKTIEKYALFPNNGQIIEKGTDYFVIKGTGVADVRIVGERIGYANTFYNDIDSHNMEVVEDDGSVVETSEAS